jgi:hypothetical protein
LEVPTPAASFACGGQRLRRNHTEMNFPQAALVLSFPLTFFSPFFWASGFLLLFINPVLVKPNTRFYLINLMPAAIR